MTAEDQRVIVHWVALCPITVACQWREPGHVSEQFAMEASRAHGGSDNWYHTHKRGPQPIAPGVAATDVVPLV